MSTHFAKEEVQELYPDGSIKAHYTLLQSPEGLQFLQGAYKIYSPTGGLLSESHFSQGKKQGLSTAYHLNGKPSFEGFFEEDLPEGEQLYWYSDGRLKSKILYAKGILHGLTSLYHSNGNLKREVCFQEGKRHGKEKVWTYRGSLTIEKNFVYGALIAEKYWTYNGILVEERLQKHPSIPKDIIRWDTNGTLRSKLIHSSDGSFSYSEWTEDGVLSHEVIQNQGMINI